MILVDTARVQRKGNRLLAELDRISADSRSPVDLRVCYIFMFEADEENDRDDDAAANYKMSLVASHNDTVVASVQTTGNFFWIHPSSLAIQMDD